VHASLIFFAPLLGFVAAVGFSLRYGITAVDAGLLCAMYVATVIGVEIGFHRCLSHNAFHATEPVKVVLAIFGSMAAQGPVSFGSNHRRHHLCSDDSEDPHSPYGHGGRRFGLIRGLWHAHVGWTFIHQMTYTNRFSSDLVRDRVVSWVNRYYLFWIALGLAFPALIGGLATGTWVGAVGGFLWGGLARVFLVQQATFSVNSVCHCFGRRPFSTRDHSTNSFVLAIPTFGQAWHNNHHAFPFSAVTGFAWWQLDLGGLFIRALQRIGLAWDVRVPDQEQIGRKSKRVSRLLKRAVS
jgi:stearoyl-CoA desaturase (delta-9 desaturase)